MSFYPATGKFLESVTHDEELDRIPCGFRIIEPVGIIELSAKLSDNALDDVSSSGQPRSFKVNPDIAELGAEGFEYLLEIDCSLELFEKTQVMPVQMIEVFRLRCIEELMAYFEEISHPDS
jgi:hypothetical protein